MSYFDTTIYPVGFCIFPFTSADFQALPSNTCNPLVSQEDVETRLAKIGLNQDRFSTALVTQMTTLHTSFKLQRNNLKGRIQTLISTNTSLQLLITTSQSQIGGILLLRDERITILEEQNKKMKEEMNKLIARQTEENQLLQEQIHAAETERQQAVAAGQAVWNKTQNTLCSRIQSLQSQLSILQTNFNAVEKEKAELISKKTALNGELGRLQTSVNSLQITASDELVRQQAAIKTKIANVKQNILNIIDRDLNLYKQVGGPSWQSGKFYDRETTAWALQKARNVFSKL